MRLSVAVGCGNQALGEGFGGKARYFMERLSDGPRYNTSEIAALSVHCCRSSQHLPLLLSFTEVATGSKNPDDGQGQVGGWRNKRDAVPAKQCQLGGHRVVGLYGGRRYYVVQALCCEITEFSDLFWPNPS